MVIQLTLEQVKSLIKKDYTIENEARTGNNLGTVLKLTNGCIINCWDKGTVNCQGKNVDEINKLLIGNFASPSSTIIEKLEEFTAQVNFGIVLATPDDVGYPKGDESQKRYRARQNVVLELGMLLSRIGREKVAILLSQTEEMEKPSDIDGLIYIPFKDDVEEVKLSLAKEMQNNGYVLDISKL